MLTTVTIIKKIKIVFHASLVSDPVFCIDSFRLVLKMTNCGLFCYIAPNVVVYGLLRGLALNFARKMVGCCKDFIAPEKYKKNQKNHQNRWFFNA